MVTLSYPDSIMFYSSFGYDHTFITLNTENTNTTGGLFLANQQFTDEILADPFAENIILLITDGKATPDKVMPGWNERLFDVVRLYVHMDTRIQVYFKNLNDFSMCSVLGSFLVCALCKYILLYLYEMLLRHLST